MDSKLRSAHSKHIKSTQKFLMDNSKPKNDDKQPVNTDNIDVAATSGIADIPEVKDLTVFDDEIKRSTIALAKKTLGLPDDFEYDENTVFVDATELNNLVQQNHDLKSEVGKLVGLFQHFTGLFSGANIMSIAMKIPSLIKDEGIKAQVELVLPIIEKYKPKA